MNDQEASIKALQDRVATLEKQVAALQHDWTNTVEAAVRDFMDQPISTSWSYVVPGNIETDTGDIVEDKG